MSSQNSSILEDRTSPFDKRGVEEPPEQGIGPGQPNRRPQGTKLLRYFIAQIIKSKSINFL